MSTRLASQPNVTPMIDVMLVLLIIFMVVAPLLTGSVAEPPRGTNLLAHPERDADITLVIDKAGHFFLEQQPIGEGALPAALRTIYARRDDHTLYLSADRRADYAVVLDAIGVARASGVAVVGMIAEQERTTP